MNTLPFTWQNIYDWYISRHYQPAEAYTQADKLWKAVAPAILNEMANTEVEQFTQALIAEHGEYEGYPDITERVFPRCLSLRLQAIAYEKKWASQHQGAGYRIVHSTAMVALHVRNFGEEWMWEVIHGNLIDKMGTAKTEDLAWADAEKQWQISQSRLNGERKVLV